MAKSSAIAFSTLCWLNSAAFSGSDIDALLRRAQKSGVDEVVDENEEPDHREEWVIHEARFTWEIRRSSTTTVGCGRVKGAEAFGNSSIVGDTGLDMR